jgi:hypothetical protein
LKERAVQPQESKIIQTIKEVHIYSMFIRPVLSDTFTVVLFQATRGLSFFNSVFLAED